MLRSIIITVIIKAEKRRGEIETHSPIHCSIRIMMAPECCVFVEDELPNSGLQPTRLVVAATDAHNEGIMGAAMERGFLFCFSSRGTSGGNCLTSYLVTTTADDGLRNLHGHRRITLLGS